MRDHKSKDHNKDSKFIPKDAKFIHKDPDAIKMT